MPKVRKNGFAVIRRNLETMRLIVRSGTAVGGTGGSNLACWVKPTYDVN